MTDLIIRCSDILIESECCDQMSMSDEGGSVRRGTASNRPMHGHLHSHSACGAVDRPCCDFTIALPAWAPVDAAAESGNPLSANPTVASVAPPAMPAPTLKVNWYLMNK